MRARSLLPALLLLLAACSRLLDPDKIAPVLPASVTAFCSQAEAALSSRGAACQATTLEEQVQNRTWLPCRAWDNEVAARHAVFDPYAAADCLAVIPGSDCATLFGRNGRVPYACQQAVLGQQGPSAPCEIDAACNGGYCRVGTTCMGVVCSVYLNLNDTGCSADPRVGAQCQPDLVCAAGTCLSQRFVNESCAGLPVICEPGATCDGASCVLRRLAGEVCAEALDCQPGLVCGATVLTPLTRRCLVPVPPGGACTVGHRQCLGGTHCRSASQAPGSTGTCVVSAPVGAASGVCDPAAAEPLGCLGGYCATATGTCTSFIPESLACLSTDQCGPGGLCNAGVAVCYKSCAP
jgi:hypothetical protein